jgi:UrcA family protein
MSSKANQSRRTANSRTKFCAIAALAWFVGVPAAIAAEPSASAEEASSSKVSLSDLDLSTPSGLHKAQERLSSAAQRLCHNYSDPNRAPNYATMNACYHETMDTALRQLTALAANAEARRSEVAQNQP